jgi:diguanylate cyclase (GGDEF)-like protein/PAS domain S-box-containing protein
MAGDQLVVRSVEARSSATGADVASALAAMAVGALDDPAGLQLHHLRTVVAELPVGIIRVDAHGMITASFGGVLGRVGLEDDDLAGAHVSVFGPVAAEEFATVLAGSGGRFIVEGDASGSPWRFDVLAAPLPVDGGLVAVAVDTSGELAAELELIGHDEIARTALEASRESEERFRRLAESAPIGIFLTTLDGTLLFGNSQMEHQAGRSVSEIAEIGWLETVHPDDRGDVEAAATRWLEGEDFLIEYRVVRPDASVVWIRARLAYILDDGGHPTGIVGTSADITSLIDALAALAEREERNRAILETAAEAIITCDDQGVVVEFNAAAERLFGFDSGEVVGSARFDEFIDDAERESLLALFLDADAPDGPPVGIDLAEVAPLGVVGPFEIRVRNKQGGAFPVMLSVTEVTTSAGRLYTAVMHDISDRRRFEQELEHQATHDALTKLPNRALLYAELDAALNRAARSNHGTSVLFIELDRLRVVTGSLGHRARDQVVIETARRITRVVGQRGTVGVFSGDQFVVVVEEPHGVSSALEVVAAIHDALGEPFHIGAEEAFLSAHTGIAFTASGANTAERLIANADVAMNRARSTATPWELFDAEMRAFVDRRRRVEAALRRALDRGEFELYYQPMVRVADLAIQGFEALVRWNHPDLGILPPAEFIPVAEEAGLIVPLGVWVLEQACEQLARWQAEHPDAGLRVAVNLSARQLGQHDLPDILGRLLTRSGADPSGLHVEITESVLLDDLDTAVEGLLALKALGVNVVMDDFGTGYSSLTYLCRLPIDAVKVDRSFVSQLGTSSRDATVVGLVVGLAQTLNLDVVAEGVETDTQLSALRSMDCSMAQGYLFAKPMPVLDADLLLERS